MVLINCDGGIPCFLFAQSYFLWWLYPKVSAFLDVNNTKFIPKKNIWTLGIDRSCKTGSEKKKRWKEDLGSLSLWHISDRPLPALAAQQRIKIKWLNKEIRSRWRLARAAPGCPPILQLVTSMIKKTCQCVFVLKSAPFGACKIYTSRWVSISQKTCLVKQINSKCDGQINWLISF